MTEEVKNQTNQNTDVNKEETKSESIIPELNTSTAANEAPKLSEQEVQELLSMRKEMKQAKMLEELYAPVGGKAGYEALATKIEATASVEQKEAINALLRNQETAKQAITLMQGLVTSDATKEAAPESSPLPPIGSGSVATNTNNNTSNEGDDMMEAPSITIADNIAYSNVKDPLVKKALDKIENDVLAFTEQHGHERFDSSELIHEKAVKYLEPIVDQAEKMKNKERAQEALLAYNAILRPAVHAAIANEDPIPARIVENAKQLVEKRNVDNRLQGKESLDYFADMFTVDEARQQTVNSLFSTKKEFTF